MFSFWIKPYFGSAVIRQQTQTLRPSLNLNYDHFLSEAADCSLSPRVCRPGGRGGRTSETAAGLWWRVCELSEVCVFSSWSSTETEGDRLWWTRSSSEYVCLYLKDFGVLRPCDQDLVWDGPAGQDPPPQPPGSGFFLPVFKAAELFWSCGAD